MDVDLFQSFSKVDKTKPREVECFFKHFDKDTKKDTLGFDWEMYNTGKSGGYVSLEVNIYYYKGQIASYKLWAELPHRSDLVDQYRKLYTSVLPDYSEGTYLYQYKPDIILKPLTQYQKHTDITPQMASYMSPTAELIYGIAGGLPITILNNRQYFNALKNNLSNNQLVALMYAINPVSRLTAIEYYYKHKSEFVSQEKFDAWIERVYQTKPVVQTISGCIIYNDNARKLVDYYSKY